jgi:hypothetical protein
MKQPAPCTRRIVALAALLVAATLAPMASADDGAAAAAEHAKKANVAFSLQDWAEAIAQYQAAYRADQKLEYLWGLAQAQRLQGDLATAIRSYKAFLRAGPSAKQAAVAEQQIAKCEADLAKHEADAKAAAPAKPEPAAPAPTPTAPAPPETQPKAPTPPPPRATPERPGPWYADPLGDVLTVGGVGLVAAGAVFTAKGASSAASTSGTRDEVVARHDDARTQQVLGVSGLAVGGVLLANGILRYVLVEKRRPSPSAGTGAQVSAAAAPGAASLTFTGRF